MYKRIVVILLIIALLPSLFVPASASSFNDSVYDSGMIYTDYKTSSFYAWESSSYAGNTYSVRTDISSASFNSINNLEVMFVPTNLEYPSDYMMFCIYALRKPKDDSVFVEYGDGVPYTAAYEGGLYAENRYNYYFYRVTMAEECKYINISLNTNGTYTGDYGIYSCFGYTSVIDNYAKADFYIRDRYFNTEGEYISSNRTLTAQNLPYTFRNDTSTNLVSSDITIRLDSDRFKTTAVENVTLYFNTYCENFRVTASLISRDANVQNVAELKYNLLYDSAWGLVNDYEIGLGTAYQYAGYQLEVDLSGYDMDKYELVVSISVDSVSWDSDDDFQSLRCVEITLRSITYVPTLVVSPWYQPIKNMIDQMRNYIVNGLDSIYTVLSGIWWDLEGNVSLFFEKWEDRWDSLMSKLEEYFSGDEEISEQGDVLQEQGEQLQENSEALGSIDLPAIDAGTMLDSYMNYNQDSLAFLSIMTNNSFATPMLIVVFTFGLVGYIFFGKKG